MTGARVRRRAFAWLSGLLCGAMLLVILLGVRTSAPTSPPVRQETGNQADLAPDPTSPLTRKPEEMPAGDPPRLPTEVLLETPPPLPGPPGEVAGMVVRANGVDPVPDATVILEFDVRSSGVQRFLVQRQQTDARGAFRFESLPVGVYRITGEHPAYAARTLEGLELSMSAGINDVRIQLLRESANVGVVEGRVLLPSGAPLQQPSVFIEGASEASGRFADGKPDGTFRFDRLLPGLYNIRVFYKTGDVLEPSRTIRTVVRVRAGEIVRLAFGGKFSFHGLLLDSIGEPIPDTTILLQGLDPPSQWFKVKTEGDGTFCVEGISAGRHRLKAILRVETGLTTTTVGDVLIETDDQHQTLQVPGGKIRGRVVADPPLTVHKGACSIWVSLIDPHAQDRNERRGTEMYALTAPDVRGRYEVRGLVAGRYRLLVSAKGYRQVDKEVTITLNEELDRFDVQLEGKHSGMVQLWVRTLDGHPIPEVSLRYQEEEGGWRPLASASPSPGLFRFSGLEEGRWRVRIGSPGYQSKIVEVDVWINDTTEVEVVLDEE